MMRCAILLLLLTAVMPARDRIAYIEFFGNKGIDVEAVRAALPFHAGDVLSKEREEQARAAVKRVTGRDLTNFAAICCTGDADSAVFIGLPGDSSHAFELDPAPSGDAVLSAELIELSRKMQDAQNKALQNGQSEEEGGKGYRLSKDPGARAAQLAVREYALAHEDELIRVLESSGRAGQRAIAADTLGYCARSPRQLAALVHAARDRNSTVRNQATRAVGEILEAEPPTAAQVAPDTFIDMLRSGTWTDRNKGCMMMTSLTQSRDPKLLARVKAESEDALWEIARWRNIGWAFCAREILGRAAGIPEEKLQMLSWGPLDGFVAAMGR
jgi:hypothetical protein